MRTAAKVIFLSRSVMPAPAFTDHLRIFIAEEANSREREILIAHEQAHIWLNHHTRKAHDFSQDSFSKALWDFSLELEIARNIYTPEDEDEIKKPFTILSGGVVRNTVPDLPEELIMAEDIYKWLQKNPDKQPAYEKFCSCPAHEHDESEEGTEEQEISVEEIDQIKEAIEEYRDTMRSREQVDRAHITRKIPSLASDIDYILRSRKIRNRTYARPSRRSCDPFILKGRKKRKKAPRVEIFVDRSGSMSGEKTGASVEKLKTILRKYGASIRNDVFYFSDEKIYDHDIPPRGSNPYPLVMEHLERTRPKIAVILTDYDTSSTEGLKPLSHRETEILCVPVCAKRTAISDLIGAKDVF